MPDIEWAHHVTFPPASESLRRLQEGHSRFKNSRPHPVAYSSQLIEELWEQQRPIAAVIACCDSRVSPEIIFDQPLGSLFVSRVPGNVASDSAKWMLDIAVAELRVPMVLVMGHTGCLAVKQMVENKIGGAGGDLRLDVKMAVERARIKEPVDPYRQSVIENVYLTIENLATHSTTIETALRDRATILIGALYDMETGSVELLPEENPS